MRATKKAVLFLVVGFFLFGCSVPKGDSLQAKRDYVYQMKSETLARLYQEKPISKNKIESAAGYAVFSSVNTNLLLLSSASGYGVCENKRTGRTTYMKMFQLGVGPGLGLKDYRAVFIFYDPLVLNKFVDEGWEFGGQADATAKSAEKGGAVGAQGSFDQSIEIYTLTEAGVSLQATIAGTKYWKDDELN
jgi:lipid-binding SYLF domain-containing protein